MSNEGSTKDKTQEELKIDELNLAEASTYVHLFTRSCTILGYAVILCLCTALYMKVVSLVNFTDQFYPNGLPKVNLYNTTFLLYFLSMPFFGVLYTFTNHNLYEIVGRGLSKRTPSFQLHYFKYMMMYSIVTCIVLFLCTYLMSELGFAVAICDNIQIIFGMVMGIVFIALNIKFMSNKLKPFKDHTFIVLKKDEPTGSQLVAKTETACKQLISIVKSVGKVFGVVSFGVYYVNIGIVLFRNSGGAWRAAIALIVHPLIVECLTTIMKFSYGEKSKFHPFYDHLMTFVLECVLNLFRRFLFNDTNNMNLTLLLVVLSGFQEVLIRSTMEWKEGFMRRIMGSPPMSDDIKVLKRKYYSYTVTARSILELVCILISPIMFTFFFNNRYAIDLGYNNMNSIDYESMISSTALQLCVELMVIYCCSLIEVKNGIPMSDFFYQFRDFRVFRSHLASFIAACSWILYNFKTVPSSLICSDSNNPCSCPSFSVYQQLCSNLTSLNSTVSVKIESSNLTSAFSSSSDITIVILSVLGLICIITVTYYFVSKRNNEKYRVQVERSQRILFKTAIDATTLNMMEQSSLQQAISTIESFCRGVPPSQARLLQSVVETLKAQAKLNNVIDIEKMFLNEVNQDEGTKIWLKAQLMSHEQQIIASTKYNNNAGNRKNDRIDQKRMTAIRNSVVGQLGVPLTENGNMESISKTTYLLSVDENIPLSLSGSNNDDKLDVLSWDFNVFAIENKNPQSWLAWKAFSIFSRYQVEFFEEFNIPKLQFTNFLIYVEQNYSLVNYDSYSAYGEPISNSNLAESLDSNDLKDINKESKGNRYHNNLHGADVFQGVLHFATKYDEISTHLSQFDLITVLFAAYIHDFNHPGLNTTYVNSDWPSSGISSTFGTESPLEKHHLAMAFNLMRNDDQYNFLVNCSSDKLDYFRKVSTECVMATDLAKNMSWISSAKIAFKDWRNEMSHPQDVSNEDQKSKDEKKEMEYKLLLMQLSIKCADVGHPCRSLDQHLEWSRRIRDEFYCQGDKEREKGRKISPLCDRNVSLSNYPQSQIGFINYVSKPCFMLLNEVCWSKESEDEKPWLKYMNSNIQYWEDRKKEVQII